MSPSNKRDVENVDHASNTGDNAVTILVRTQVTVEVDCSEFKKNIVKAMGRKQKSAT